MKPCLVTIYLSVSLAANLIPVEGFGEPMRVSMKTEQISDKHVPNIDKNIEAAVMKMTSQVDRVVFLKSFITNNLGESPEENLQKATALRLMGDYGGSNAIPVLVENLEYEDTKHHDTPSVSALVAIGEPAVQPLLRVVAASGNKHRTSLAVQALMAIKGTQYDEFVEEQKDRMNADTGKNLLRYTIQE